ncbi:hypothetical protein ACFVYT_42165 [Streptomyces sp. NPDC058290]|uniref:hypothetical protein n=1 Tax=Streptomyces sp. NPDC058290 TaxID=3346426 RepID=UPI0036ECC3ED
MRSKRSCYELSRNEKHTVRIIAGDTADDLQVSVNSDTRSIAFAATSSQVSHTSVHLQGPV